MPRRLLARINFLGLGTFLAFLLLWEVAVRSKAITSTYLPPPSRVVTGLGDIASNGELADNLQHTLTSALTGWALAGVVGIVLGTALGLFRPLWMYSMASVEAIRALPMVAFVPVAVLLLGFTTEMEVTIAFIASLWPILLNTFAGMRSIGPRMTEVGQVLRLSPMTQIWKLRLPAATSHIVVGLRLGLTLGLVLTLVSEMVGNPAGLGFALVSKAQALQPEQMFAYVVVVGIVGIVLNAILVTGARLLFRGQMLAAGETA
jgi:ABC-type nitrate/sulfonate/bicarbonate transport system permease component